MKLITKEIEKRFATVGEQIHSDNPRVICKFFTPWTYWTWYVTEYYPDAKVCYGFVMGDHHERGYFSVSELEKLHGPFGLRIERDTHRSECFFNDLNIYTGQKR